MNSAIPPWIRCAPVTALFALYLFNAQASRAWVYPEHRDITLLAVQKMDPHRWVILDRIWADTVGEIGTRLNLPSRTYDQVDISPDGKWIATNAEQGEPFPAIWVAPMEAPERALPLTVTGSFLRLTWTPHSRHLLYATLEGGTYRSWRRPADGSAPPVLETEGCDHRCRSDGRSIYLRDNMNVYKIKLDMSSGIRTTGSVEHLFSGSWAFNYAVHPTTGRLLVAAPSGTRSGDERSRTDLILNWSESLGLETPGD
ncbi:MAG: hypothetical protein WBD30_00270 [Bacteroidota bacterium]